MNRYLAEVLGSFLIVYVVLVTDKTLPVILSLILSVLLFMKVSGASFNPLLTLAMYFKGMIYMNDLIGFVAAQLVGTYLAYYLSVHK